MNGLTTSWKIFRVISIIQLVLVSTQLMLSIVELFYNASFLYSFTGIVIYSLVFYFVYHGLSLLNYNFPDTPLTDKQKQTFNRLFIINFLLIAYLFAQVVRNWWIIPLLYEADEVRFLNLLTALIPFLLPALVFALHLVFLAGMIVLRRTIHQNTLDTWYRQFDENKQEESPR